MSYNFEVESGKTVKFPVGGKYCDRDIVVSAVGGMDNFYAKYASDKVLWLDSEHNTLSGHSDGASKIMDLTGNGYNAVITGVLPYNEGYTFGGSAENYITVPKTALLDKADELTYETVWHFVDVSGTQRLLFSSGLQTYIAGGQFRCDLNFDGAPKEQPIAAAVAGRISFAVVFKANDFQKLFINGVEIQSFTAGVNSVNAPEFYIGQGSGQYPTKSGNKFLAMRAYNRALTAEELMGNYNLDAERWGA